MFLKNPYWQIILFLSFPFLMKAQVSQAYRDSINKLSWEDHRLMLDKLDIDSLRPGPSGDPSAPNAANSDEAKVKPLIDLPDPLQFDKGDTVANKPGWEKRRKEIIAHFNREMYGKVPGNVPEVSWKIISEKDSILGTFPVTIQKLKGIVDNSSYPEIEVAIDLSLTIPKNQDKPVPVILKFDWIWPGMPQKKEVEEWKKLLLKENWGFASLIPTSYQADNGAGLRRGIIGLTNKGEPREQHDWGSLRAWAWGASEVLNYFENIPEVDASRVIIEGLSRYGKAAMVTMAYDERFAGGFIGSSGAGGAKILRRNFGEQVENLASSAEYHWFSPSFIKYAGPLSVNDLSIDGHHLVALAAPRPVFISTGNPEVEGNWVDARGMFLAGKYASPVYELLGYKGLVGGEYPGVGSFLNEGRIAFRAHEGGHTVEPNWPYFIDFIKPFLEKDN
ncbi:acetylxylan esterase [Gramella sp. GC03-9]|uniref:Acetylxylan esterase n=1 Tax=Christiangramia oceanisediminis TaxID=2920386 RepID=A0A9X2KVV6_9FLAO|nr:acetylxylan esterase [Gramella oceanisediminis]MCP9199125.1 acetylxylan esterase [Gramella oceanisediminis]